MEINVMLDALSDAYARQKQIAEQLRKELMACQAKLKELTNAGTSTAENGQVATNSLSKGKSNESAKKSAKPVVKGGSAPKK